MVPSAKKKEVEKEVPKVAAEKKNVRTIEPLRGMKDILPREGAYWLKMFRTAEAITEAYGYGYIETPVIELSQLFVRSVGKGTDIVDKEMYIFEDKDGTKVCLRPEGTASVARAYIHHGMHAQPQPVKVWYQGPMFRHDRPQAGRYRQFHQFSAEVLGERDPVLDAELVSMSYNFLRDLGIESEVHINSIGTVEDRQNYIVELVGYLRSKRSYLSEESKARITKNPLRVLDSKAEQDLEIIREAPQIIDWLSAPSKDFFMKVLEYLDELQVPYVLRPTLVRGLDYYSDTVFELYGEQGEEGAQSALGGGGRYDSLVEQLGGRPTPAAGFSLGLERVASLLKKKEPPELRGKEMERKIFFAQLGEQARRRALYLIEEIRRKGITVGFNLAKTSLKSQLEIANKMGSTHTVILGQKEVQDGTVIIRDMDSGIQEIVDQRKIEAEIRKLLK